MNNTRGTALRASSKRLAALATGSLVVVSLTMVGAPAQAGSDALGYTCATALGAKPFSVTFDNTAPDRLLVGKTVSTITSADITLPEEVAGLIVGFLGAASFDGTATLAGFLNGVAQPVALTVPKTTVVPNSPLVVPASGPGGVLTGEKVGDVFTLSAGDLASTLTFYKTDGTLAYGPADIPCALDAGQDATIKKITVVDGTKSRVRAAYKKGAKKVTAASTVTSKHGSPVTGKVAFVLKKGKKSIRKTTAGVNAAGTAKAVFKRINGAGKYKVVATYKGSRTLNRSTGSASFIVK